MRTRKTRLLSLVMIFGMVLLGFQVTDVQAFEVLEEEEVVTETITKQELVRLVDNFIVLFDASGSMDAMYKDTGLRRIQAAKKILQERNQLIPDLGYNAGLYVFGPQRPVHDLKRYNRAEFGAAIDKLPTTTRVATRRSKDIRGLDNLLAGLSGRTAVFMFTDGQFVPPGPQGVSVVDAAKELVAKYNVCMYPISSAQTPRQHAQVKALASVNACSRVIPFDELYGRPESVGGVLYVVEDIVIMKEGVLTRVAGVKMDNILFDFDSSAVGPEFKQELNELGKYLQKNSEAYLVLSGFTDNIGTEEYNLWLSRRRAESVANYLKQNFGIGEERITNLWYGFADPVASNDTPEGRALNRRVAPVVGGI